MLYVLTKAQESPFFSQTQPAPFAHFLNPCLQSFLAFLAFVALDEFFKQKLAFADEKLSTIDLFPTIRCQNQFPNKSQQSESVRF